MSSGIIHPKLIKDTTGLEENATSGLTNLIANYPFDGNANDVSGNGNNGTVGGATLTTDRFGQTNKAYDFDGLNDIISLPLSVLQFGTSDFSISAWFKTSDITGRLTFLSNYSPVNTPADKGTVFELISGQIHFYIVDSSNSVRVLYTIDASYENKWNFVVCCRKSNISYIYVNGKFVAVSAALSVNVDIMAGNVYICKVGDTYGTGQVDAVKVYDRALTQSEILDLFYEQPN